MTTERWYDEGRARFSKAVHRARRKVQMPTTRVRRSWVRLYKRLGDRLRNMPPGPFLFLLLALPLAAQSPVGTWEADTTRVIAGASVTETGVITFAPDGSYVAQRAWRWRVDDVPGGEFAFAQGTWRTAGDTLCVRREDAQAETCQPYAATAHTLTWGGFQFTGGAE